MILFNQNYTHGQQVSKAWREYLTRKPPDVQIVGDDFIFAAHWISTQMLRTAMRQTQPTDPRKVAFALEGMKYQSPVGDVEMRKTDHRLQSPLFLGMWAKQGSRGVKRGWRAGRVPRGWRAVARALGDAAVGDRWGKARG